MSRLLVPDEYATAPYGRVLAVRTLSIIKTNPHLITINIFENPIDANIVNQVDTSHAF